MFHVCQDIQSKMILKTSQQLRNEILYGMVTDMDIISSFFVSQSNAYENAPSSSVFSHLISNIYTLGSRRDDEGHEYGV